MDKLLNTLLLKTQACRDQKEKPFHHALRAELEDPIFDYLRETYGKQLEEFWRSATFPKVSETPNTVLMVERRVHPNMRFCLQNCMYFTRKQNFSLTIVCSKENEQQIRDILGKHLETTDLQVLWDENGPKAWEEYSRAFMSEWFWERIQATHILSIQTDCYLRQELPEFLWDVDYAACPWAWKAHLVGGGGITFRNRDTTIQMCKSGLSHKFRGEDVYFSYICQLKKTKVLPPEIAETIFSESRFVDNPVGVHQWWTYMFQTSDIKTIQKYFSQYLTIFMKIE